MLLSFLVSCFQARTHCCPLRMTGSAHSWLVLASSHGGQSRDARRTRAVERVDSLTLPNPRLRSRNLVPGFAIAATDSPCMEDSSDHALPPYSVALTPGSQQASPRKFFVLPASRRGCETP